MIKLTNKDKVILIISSIGALILLLFGSLSIVGKIGMSVILLSTLFILLISTFIKLSITKTMSNKLKNMPRSEAKTYLQEQGFTKKEVDRLLKLTQQDNK